MKPLLLLILFFTSLFFTFAQEVTVSDAKTSDPVEGVLIYSKTVSTQTDATGKANLQLFQSSEQISFKHSSYLSYKTTPARLMLQGNMVKLIENPVRLDEVVVSVIRRQQSKTEVPNKVSVIYPEEIKISNPQTTADLLGTESGIFIQKSQLGGGSPMIRGFSANRLLIVVDGIRMNNAIYRSGNLQNVISVDANSLESTEIIFGPGSVIYGSDALGGVMSFNTMTPKLSTSVQSKLDNHVLTRYSTADNEKTVHGDFNFGKEKWAFLFSGTYTDFDDLKMGQNGPAEYLRPEFISDEPFQGEDLIIINDNPKIQRYSGYSQLNLMGKFRFRPNEKIELNVGSHYSATSDIPRYDRLIVYSKGNLKSGDWYYGPQVWSMQTLNGRFTDKTFLFDRVNLIAAFQDYKESRNDRKLNDPELQSREEKLSIWSANLDFDKNLNKTNLIYYGIETYFNNVGSEGKTSNLLTGVNEPIAPRYPETSKYNSAAAYISYQLNYRKKLTFQSGLRYTRTHLEGIFNQNFNEFPFNGFNNTNEAFTGNVGIVCHPTEEWQLNLNTSTGFRSPNIDDISKTFDSEPGNVVVPNPDLKPEYTRNIEFDIIRSFASKAKIEVNGFYTRLKDAMVRRDFTFGGLDSILYDGELSKVEALVNAESATIYGASLSFEFLFSNSLRTRNDLTIIKGEDSDGKPVRHVPPTFGHSHLIWQYNAWYIDLYAQYNGEIPYSKLEDSERSKPYMYATDSQGYPYSPSWWTLNLKSTYKLNKHITFSGGIENILNKRYRPYSSGIVAPGINFIFSVLAGF